MTIKYLLDTNIVSNPVSRRPDYGVIRRLELHGAECAIASPIWHELHSGVRRLEASRRRETLEAYLEEVVTPSFPILAYDERAAMWHAEERARLEGLGLGAPFVDGQIAAIAHTNGLILVTTNAKDFRHFRALKLEDWTTKRSRAR